MTNDLRGLAKRTAVVSGVTLLLLVLLCGAGYAFQILMLVFAGLLFAILLRAITDFVKRYTPWNDGIALLTAVLLVLGTTVGLVWFLAPQVASQADQLGATLPQSYEQLTAQLDQYHWGKWLLRNTPPPEQFIPTRDDLLSRVTGIFSGVLSAIGGLIVVFFIGLYFAVQPRLYQRGIIRLVPLSKRDRAEQVLSQIGTSLRWWLLGKLAAMMFIGVLVWLSLMLLGLPFALTLGVIAALLTFIPNFGPIISAIPAVLIGFMQDPMTAGWVIAIFIAIQGVESYILTPLVQQSMLNLPAALTITAQMILGVLVGGIGLALATPLTLVVLVLVRMLYVHDALGDHANEN